MRRSRSMPLMGALLALTLLAGCATQSTDADATAVAAAPTMSAAPGSTDNDPLEPINRGIFWVNEGLDMLIIKPVAQVYKAVIPNPVQRGVTNVLQNLREPLNFANQSLQGDWEGAGNAIGRFTVNSTIGLLGLFDVGQHMGMPYEYESLEQTLALWGVPEGPYLVLPLIGGSSLRDAPALLAETLADPMRIAATQADEAWLNNVRTGLIVVDTRATYLDVIDDLRRNSIDYYAAMRSLYRQRRDGWIRDGAPASSTDLPEIPDYESDAAP